MPNPNHPFDEAMTEKARREWDEAVKNSTIMTQPEAEEVRQAIRNTMEQDHDAAAHEIREERVRPESKPRRIYFPFWLLGFATVVALLISLVRPQLPNKRWTGWVEDGAPKGLPTNATLLERISRKEWTFEPDFPKKTVTILFENEARLIGSLSNAPELNVFNEKSRRFYHILSLTNVTAGGPPITGSGILDMSSPIFSKSDTTAPQFSDLQSVKLHLDLNVTGMPNVTISRKIEQDAH
jgi:hypothetical protein